MGTDKSEVPAHFACLLEPVHASSNAAAGLKCAQHVVGGAGHATARMPGREVGHRSYPAEDE